MEVKVVTGANYGDEGKGMVSYALAHEAVQQNKKVLTVLYNGGVQRAHTVGDQVLHCVGAGDVVGGDTYYDHMFLVDPIALWMTGTKVYIHPECRVVIPCDVMRNREREVARGAARHGSCGLGIFDCVKRSETGKFDLRIHNLCFGLFDIYDKLVEINKEYPYSLDDGLYTLDNFMKACQYILDNCTITNLYNLAQNYDTIIYEGGQGLLLDQQNKGDFPHLTPSSVGSYNIHSEIQKLNPNATDVFYVSRSYMTRHGAGPMEAECAKDAINATIIDKTNMPNDWQGSLRFGKIDKDSLQRRISGDFSRYKNANMNMVFTQMNYTNGKIATVDGLTDVGEILLPQATLWLSDQKDVINKISI